MSGTSPQPATTFSPSRFGWRRALFFSIVFVCSSLGVWVMADILWRGGITRLEWTLLILFVPLFSLVVFGFVQALAGFVMLMRGDPLRIVRSIPISAAPDPSSVTALVVPICNEDVSRVYEGIRTTYLDLCRRGSTSGFDFFILSDTREPNLWIEEEMSWVELCKQLKAFGKIFYRHRQLSLNRKSGNIADFCRRWGRRYRYMVILDADSLMDGEALSRLVALMDAHPSVGIIQTVPQLMGGETLFARFIQFAASLYTPVFAAGMNFWQTGEGNYWGHNAIIRLAPFMQHCALPSIPIGQRRARFMSHDYVEAALMRRAGYAVWLATDLAGSYEGIPPSLVDHARRDRRWCRGNLQHSWLLFARGFHGINRLHLLLGIMSYLASFLWFLFLVLGTLHTRQEVRNMMYRRFDYDVGLTSFLDIGGIRLSLILFSVTIGMLILPKLLSLLLALVNRERRDGFGGVLRLTLGVIVEQMFSTLLAPVHMLFHTQAVLGTWLGYEVSWGGQRRDQGKRPLGGEVVVTHLSHTLIGLAWGGLAYAIRPVFCWWLSPVWLGLALSMPLSLLLGHAGTGRWGRRFGLWLTPQETRPQPVLSHLRKNLDACRRHLPPLEPLREDYGLLQVVLDPYINAVHAALLRRRQAPKRIGEYYEVLQQRLLREGPGRLQVREKLAILHHYPTVESLHQRLWLAPYGQLSTWWRLAMKQYNTLTTHPETALYR
jgi:membrane glycosyltransferase